MKVLQDGRRVYPLAGTRGKGRGFRSWDRANACSSDGLIWSDGVIFRSGGAGFCSLDGFSGSAGGFRDSADGFQTIANGFICSVQAQNWWVDGFRSTGAAKNTFRRATRTVTGPPICSTSAKNTVAGAKVDLVLPKIGSGPPGKTIDRANKTVEGAKKTIGDGFQRLSSCTPKCGGMRAC
jgi:hypothetical protein